MYTLTGRFGRVDPPNGVSFVQRGIRVSTDIRSSQKNYGISSRKSQNETRSGSQWFELAAMSRRITPRLAGRAFLAWPRVTCEKFLLPRWFTTSRPCEATSTSTTTTAAMVVETTAAPEFFTTTSAYSLAAVSLIGFGASTAANAFLPENARWQDRLTFVWLVRRSLLHRLSAAMLMWMARRLMRQSTSRSRAPFCTSRPSGGR